MNIFFRILPVVVLVAYSQLVAKWRVSTRTEIFDPDMSFIEKLIWYFSDPFIVSAYAAALLGSGFWLLVIARIPLSIGFPIYIGTTFVFVIAGSVFLLNESMTISKGIAIVLILAGVVIGASGDDV